MVTSTRSSSNSGSRDMGRDGLFSRFWNTSAATRALPLSSAAAVLGAECVSIGEMGVVVRWSLPTTAESVFLVLARVSSVSLILAAVAGCFVGTDSVCDGAAGDGSVDVSSVDTGSASGWVAVGQLFPSSSSKRSRSSTSGSSCWGRIESFLDSSRRCPFRLFSASFRASSNRLTASYSVVVMPY